MSYVDSDDLSSHRSVTKTGVKLMIIDGDFLGFETLVFLVTIFFRKLTERDF
jgi:hypothetical protein